MRAIILSVIFSFSILANASSQNYIFKMYRFECSELFDIRITKPKGFRVIDGLRPFRVSEKERIGLFYRLVLQSKKKDCLILFPFFLTIGEHNTTAKSMVYGELKAGLGLNVNNDEIEIDTARYVKIITGESMRNYCNADTVFVSKIPLPKPYEDIYEYCTGVNFIKTGHPFAIVKILFTEEGKKKEDEYIQVLFNSIEYSDTAPEWSQEKAEKTRKKLKHSFFFHIKKYGLTY